MKRLIISFIIILLSIVLNACSNKRYPLTIPSSEKHLENVVTSKDLLTWVTYAPLSEDFLKEKQYLTLLQDIPLGISSENFNKIVSDFNFAEKRYLERKNKTKQTFMKNKISNILTEEFTKYDRYGIPINSNIKVYKTKQVISEYDFLSKHRMCGYGLEKDITTHYNFRITKFIHIDYTFFKDRLILLSVKGPYYTMSPVENNIRNYFFGEIDIQRENTTKIFGLDCYKDFRRDYIYRPGVENNWIDRLNNGRNEFKGSKLEEVVGQKYADRIRFRVDFKPLKMTNEDILNLKNN